MCITLSICAHTPLQYRRNITSSHPAVKEMQYFMGKSPWMSDIAIMIHTYCAYDLGARGFKPIRPPLVAFKKSCLVAEPYDLGCKGLLQQI